MHPKIKIWTKRYLPAEVFGVIGVLSGGFVTNSIFGNAFLTAFGSTVGENIGYYSYIIVKEYISRSRKAKFNISFVVKLARDLLMEFGPGEYLDFFLIRPAAMYYFPKLIGNLGAGLIVGKFAADIVFYAITISSYEFRKAIFKSD